MLSVFSTIGRNAASTRPAWWWGEKMKVPQMRGPCPSVVPRSLYGQMMMVSSVTRPSICPAPRMPRRSSGFWVSESSSRSPRADRDDLGGNDIFGGEAHERLVVGRDSCEKKRRPFACELAAGKRPPAH